MQSDAIRSDESLDAIRKIVTSAVRDCLGSGQKPDNQLIERLRTYERTAREADPEGQTIQVIASGRRLLGDCRDLSPK